MYKHGRNRIAAGLQPAGGGNGESEMADLGDATMARFLTRSHFV